MQKHIFISYKHEDNDFAEALIHRIEKAGFTTWVDHDQLHIGDDWRNEIDQAIKNSFALIVIMSPEAKASEYVTYEWAFAWGAGVKVLPVLYKATALHPRLEALQHLDFTNRLARPWDTLLHNIQKIADTPPSSTAPIPLNTSPSQYSESQKTKEFWLDTGKIFLEREDYQEALDAYKQAILLDPNNAPAYIGKSKALYNLTKYKEALSASNQAIRLDPNNAQAYNNKGNALSDLKRYEEAFTVYDQAIHLDPNDALAYANKGDTLSDLKRYEEAFTVYDQAIRLDPNDTQAYNNKGNALSNLGRYEEALTAYDQVIRLDPNDALAYASKGIILFNLGRYQEALTAYDQVIRLDPNIALAYYNKGVTLTNLKRSKEAQYCYEKARQLGYLS